MVSRPFTASSLDVRILHVNKYFFEKGGAERAFLTLDRLLDGAGHEMIHFSTRDPRNLPSPWADHFVSGVRHDRAPWHPASWRAGWRMFGGAGLRAAVRRLVQNARPDVAILHNVYHQLGQPVLMDELSALGVRTLHVLHDFKIVCPAHTLLRDRQPCSLCSGGAFLRAAWHGCGGSRLRGVLLALEAYVQRRRYGAVGLFAAPSRFLIEKAKAMGFPHAIRLLRNAVPMASLPGDPRAGTAVGCATRLAPEKGLDVLLRAAARLPGIPFRLAGDGPLRAELERDRPANVTLLGRLPPEGLAQERRSWRAAVAPSLCEENLPYSVLEAFAAGLPVVGSDLGGQRELLEGRGVRVPAGDADALAGAIRGLWNDPERTARLGAEGAGFVRRECAPERVVADLESLLAEVTR
jgi:glycosyltransferase involved in cell wall biosynthesis